MKDNVGKMTGFQWTSERSQAAVLVAEGYTYQHVAAEIGKSERTMQRWMADTEFAAEVDRLSLMVGIASRAERLRVIKRIIREKTSAEGNLHTERDSLDWLKFAQSETQGIRLDLAALSAAFGQDG
jgi:uncharacterized protein YerC